MQRHAWNEANPNVCPHSLRPVVKLTIAVLPKHAYPQILQLPLEIGSCNSHDNNHMCAEPPSASFLKVRPNGSGPVMWNVHRTYSSPVQLIIADVNNTKPTGPAKIHDNANRIDAHVRFQLGSIDKTNAAVIPQNHIQQKTKSLIEKLPVAICTLGQACGTG